MSDGRKMSESYDNSMLTKTWAADGCRTVSIVYDDYKAKLFSNLKEMLRISRENKKELLNNPFSLDSIMAEGNESARCCA